MKKPHYLMAIAFLAALSMNAQYTDVINSNRPGASYSAFSVGRDVVQGEGGFFYERRDHSILETEANLYGMDFVVRYGFLFEQLEVIYDGQFSKENVTDKSFSPYQDYSLSNFTRNTLGLKYLIFDPFKNPEKNKPNLYSWRANNTMQWQNLIPAVAVYAGANFNFGDNPFYPEDPTISPKVMIATQNHFTPNWVLVMNFAYDKFTSNDPMFSYIVTLTHALPDPRYSIFVEHQGYKSDAYGDGIFRAGAARLFNKNFQVDASLGINIKDTPSRFFCAAGVSYRLDFHRDKPKRIDNLSDQNKEKEFIEEAKKNHRKRNPFEEIEEN